MRGNSAGDCIISLADACVAFIAYQGYQLGVLWRVLWVR